MEMSTVTCVSDEEFLPFTDEKYHYNVIHFKAGQTRL